MASLFRRLVAWIGAGRTLPAGPSDDAASRWLRYWNVAFLLLLAAAAILALVDPATGWSRRVGFLLIVGTIAWWYRLRVISGLVWSGGLASAAAYFLGLIAAFVALVLVHPAGMLLSAAMFWQMYLILPIRWSIPGAAAMSALLWSLGSWRNGTFRRPETDELIVLAVSVAVGGLLAAFIDAVIRQSRERQRLVEQLGASQRELASAERQAGVEQERQRLAAEIHDTLAQGFASIVVHLEAAEASMPIPATTARGHLGAARGAARDGLAESRRLVWALRPAELDRSSLPDAISRTVARWSRAGSVSARAHVVGVARRLAPETEVALLRAVQEALANVAKHAAATHVTVTLTYLEDAVSLDVQDDGRGFYPESMVGDGAGAGSGGFGLIAMRERILALGGCVAIESEAGGGTTVGVNVSEPIAMEGDSTMTTTAPVRVAGGLNGAPKGTRQ